MRRSKLIQEVGLTTNFNTRTKEITRITPHCYVGQAKLSDMLNFFKKSNNSSPNYCIDKDGKIGLSVEENNRSWCSSDEYNDQRAITIECASDKVQPYAFSSNTVDSLVNLTVDIMRRYNKDTLVYIPEKTEALSYPVKENELLVTLHRWFAKKACPGDWFVEYIPAYVNRVNQVISFDTKKGESKKLYVIHYGVYAYGEADLLQTDMEILMEAQYPCFKTKYPMRDDFFTIQLGAFEHIEYAIKLLEKLTNDDALNVKKLSFYTKYADGKMVERWLN